METMRSLYSHSVAGGSVLEPVGFISELAMEGYILENPALLRLRKDDDPKVRDFECKWVKLKKENGRIDLLVEYGDKSFAVVELKKEKIDKSAFLQLNDYMSKDQLDSVASEVLKVSPEECKWEGVLVGSSMDSELEKLLQDHNSVSANFSMAAVVLKRFSGDNHLYALTDVFYPNTKKKDNSRYVIEGDPKPYPKSALVLACIKHYIKRKSGVSFQSLWDLVEIQKENLSKRQPVLLKIDLVNVVPYKSYIGYYPEEVFTLGEVSFRIYTGWTIDVESVYLEIASRLGFKVTKL